MCVSVIVRMQLRMQGRMFCLEVLVIRHCCWGIDKHPTCRVSVTCS